MQKQNQISALGQSKGLGFHRSRALAKPAVGFGMEQLWAR